MMSPGPYEVDCSSKGNRPPAVRKRKWRKQWSSSVEAKMAKVTTRAAGTQMPCFIPPTMNRDLAMQGKVKEQGELLHNSHIPRWPGFL